MKHLCKIEGVRGLDRAFLGVKSEKQFGTKWDGIFLGK
jgi:hypothetical protein